MNTLEYYDDLPIDKVLSRGKHSDGVYLLQNKIIKKKYNPLDRDHMQYYENEIRNLTYLKECGCTFVPQILAINRKTHTIYMTYCGNSLDMLGAFIYDRYLNEIYKKIDILEAYGMVLYNKVNHKRDYRMIIDPCYICLADNSIYFVNFGSQLWTITTPKMIIINDYTS